MELEQYVGAADQPSDAISRCPFAGHQATPVNRSASASPADKKPNSTDGGGWPLIRISDGVRPGTAGPKPPQTSRSTKPPSRVLCNGNPLLAAREPVPAIGHRSAPMQRNHARGDQAVPSAIVAIAMRSLTEMESRPTREISSSGVMSESRFTYSTMSTPALTW